MPAEVDPGRLTTACLAALPRYMVPSVLVAIECWPLNSSGKVDRKALPTVQDGQSIDSCTQLCTNPEQHNIVSACREALDIPQGGLVNDVSLFEYGLTSLRAVVLHRLLRHHGLHGVKSAATILQNPTVTALVGLFGTVDSYVIE